MSKSSFPEGLGEMTMEEKMVHKIQQQVTAAAYASLSSEEQLELDLEQASQMTGIPRMHLRLIKMSNGTKLVQVLNQKRGKDD